MMFVIWYELLYTDVLEMCLSMPEKLQNYLYQVNLFVVRNKLKLLIFFYAASQMLTFSTLLLSIIINDLFP